MASSVADGPSALLRTVHVAEELLTRRHGARVRLADAEDLGGSDRSVVLRVRVTENPFSLPRSLVVKHYLPGTDAGGVDPFRYEAASCQLLTALGPDERPCAALFAHDPVARLLVLEDLGRSPTLADKLLGADPRAAERGLLSWARALGRLEATTAGRERDFGALLRRLGERAWRDPMADEARAALAELPELLAVELGVEPTRAAVEDARSTVRLLGGSRYRAYSPSDTCPEDNLVTTRGVRFLDFEWGCFRDVALDAAYFRVPFPSCECTFALPAGMAEAMLAAWRAEVVQVWPDLADDDLLAHRLLDAQLLWVWLSTWRALPRAVRGEQPGGTDGAGTSRAGLALGHYWRGLALDTARHGRQASAELASSVADALRARFRGPAADLPLYPAFR